MSSNNDIWVLIEYEKGYLTDLSQQLVSGGRQLADKLNNNVCVLAVGECNQEMAEETAAYGADKVFFLDNPRLSKYSGELYTNTLAEILHNEKAGMLLCGNTLIGKDLMPRLAAKLETGLVTNCIILETDSDNTLIVTRPTYAGEVYTRFTFSPARPWLLTLNPASMEIKKKAAANAPEIIPVATHLNGLEPRSETIGFLKGDPKEISIEESEIIVAGGRGVGSIDNFRLLEEFAEIMGASIAGSLQAVDAGWLDSTRQVGQTGKTVAPRLYIACGISGSSYHTLGMKESETVIAINTDRHAPIFKLADLAIVGNLTEVVPALIKKLRETIRPDSRVNPDEVKNILDS